MSSAQPIVETQETVPALTPVEEALASQGSWLFRWRSYLPLPLLAAMLGWCYASAPADQDDWLQWGWETLCLAVGLVGVAIRVWVAGRVPVGTSGRNTAIGQVAQSLNTAGPYSLVRHPLYLGNFMLWMGPALFTRSVLWVLLVAALFWLCYERIMLVEERFLRARFGRAFDQWARTTPVLLPRLRQWRAPVLPFSWRTAIRREYSALFGLVGVLAALEMAEEAALPGGFALDPLWETILLISLPSYLALRLLKRHTRLLRVPGR